MKMETFLRLPPPLSPPLSPPVIPGIVVDDDDVFIATLLDSHVKKSLSLLCTFFLRKGVCCFFVRKKKKNFLTKKQTKLQKKCNSYMHKR